MRNHSNIIASILVILVGIFFYYQAELLPGTDLNEFGPALMPRIYSAILIILGIILFVQSLKVQQNMEPKEKLKFVLISMGIFIGAVFLIPFLGFYLIAFLFLLLFFRITGVKKRTIIVGIPTATVIMIYLFFERLLSVPIPKGMFF